MKQSEVTVEQFAIWSFERDVEDGCFDGSCKWDKMSQGVKDSYLKEADFYITKQLDDWPIEILQRLADRSKPEYVGSIFTDVASVIIGDPCKLLIDEREKKEDSNHPLTYMDYVEKTTCPFPSFPLKGANKTLLEALAKEGLNADPEAVTVYDRDKTVFGKDAIAFRTLGSPLAGDGWVNVFVERNRKGDVIKVIIDLNAKCNPGVDDAKEKEEATS